MLDLVCDDAVTFALASEMIAEPAMVGDIVGKAQRLIQEAEAYKEQVTVIAQGEASRFTAVLNSYRLTPEVTAQRLYLETGPRLISRKFRRVPDDIRPRWRTRSRVCSVRCVSGTPRPRRPPPGCA